MEFTDLMQEVETMFNNWLNDDELNEVFNGSVEDLQKEFLKCVQNSIKSNFILFTEKELTNKLDSYHRSMEGYD